MIKVENNYVEIQGGEKQISHELALLLVAYANQIKDNPEEQAGLISELTLSAIDLLHKLNRVDLRKKEEKLNDNNKDQIN